MVWDIFFCLNISGCIYFQVLKVEVVETRYVTQQFCIYFQVLKVGVVETRFRCESEVLYIFSGSESRCC